MGALGVRATLFYQKFKVALNLIQTAKIAQ